MVMNCLAFEPPCNLKISLHILVDGLDDFLRGGAPNFWFRRVELQKCADTEECNRMLVSGKVCQGVGLKAYTDVYQACGVMPSLLSLLKLAVKAETPTYGNTRLYLQHLGNPSGLPVEVLQRALEGRGTLVCLPVDFVDVKVVEDRRGEVGRPSKTNLSLLSSFEETKSDSLINTRKDCGTIIKIAAILMNVGQGYCIQKMDLNTKLLRSALC
jgi:hypothetical protein